MESLDQLRFGVFYLQNPVEQLHCEDYIMKVQDGGTGELSQKRYDTMTGIQLGSLEDVNHNDIYKESRIRCKRY